MDSKRVAQTEAAEIAKSGAFAIRSHDGAAPKVSVVNINVFGCDIKIAAHDLERGFFFCDAGTESPIPLQFIFVRRRANGLSVRRVDGEYAHRTDSRCDDARLRIDYLVAK